MRRELLSCLPATTLLLAGACTADVPPVERSTSALAVTCDTPIASPIEEPPAGWTTVPEDPDHVLQPGERVAVASDFLEYGEQRCHRQLMAEKVIDGQLIRDHWIMCGLFSTIVSETPQQVVVVDFGGHNSGYPPLVDGQFSPGGVEYARLRAILDEIAQGRPLTLVPSHPHQDHVGGRKILQRERPGSRVVVTRGYWDAVKHQRRHLVLPAEFVPEYTVLHSRKASFYVPGFSAPYRIHTPAAVAHTAADAIVITPAGTCHVVDVLHLDRIPVEALSVAQSPEGHFQVLNHLAGLAEAGLCTQLSVGHMNLSIGAQTIVADVDRARGYLVALYDALWDTMGQLQSEGAAMADYFPGDLEDDPGDPDDPYDFHANTGLARLFLDIHERMWNFLEPSWRTVIGFSAIRTHFEPMSHQAFIERLSIDHLAPPESFYPPIENTTEIEIASWQVTGP